MFFCLQNFGKTARNNCVIELALPVLAIYFLESLKSKNFDI